jgi:hypothetical protein
MPNRDGTETGRIQSHLRAGARFRRRGCKGRSRPFATRCFGRDFRNHAYGSGLPGRLFRLVASQSTSQIGVGAAWGVPLKSRTEGLGKNYSAAPTVSPVAHAVCPHSQAMDSRSPTLSQYGLQYVLPFGTAQLQPGCLHLSVFFSAMKSPCLTRGSTLPVNP